MNIIGAIKVGLTAFITWIGWLVGGYDTMMVTLLLFMCADYISGILCGISNKELSSEVGFKGIAKKIMILLLVGATNLLGQATGIEGLRYIVISFYLANEGISIKKQQKKKLKNWKYKQLSMKMESTF